MTLEKLLIDCKISILLITSVFTTQSMVTIGTKEVYEIPWILVLPNIFKNSKMCARVIRHVQ